MTEAAARRGLDPAPNDSKQVDVIRAARFGEVANHMIGVIERRRARIARDLERIRRCLPQLRSDRE